MTGYGRSDEQNDQLILSVEVRTVNSRFLDFSPRLPKVLLPFEDDAYKLVKTRCVRGRVSLMANVDFIPGPKSGMTLNRNKLEEYMKIVKDIQKTSNREDFPSMGDILRFPNILATGNVDDEAELKKIFLLTLEQALTGMEKIRLSEGNNIQFDLVKRLDILGKFTNKIDSISKSTQNENLHRYKQKILELVNDITVDESRLYQEAAILSEKRDITEELVRLNSHIDLFNEYMDSSDNEGKKLNFLLQEMGREINTIGSKTDLIEISHLVVNLKDEIEKIREQVQNIV